MRARVTVLMPVYNGEQYLRDAIQSILQQTFRQFEFLIIDDGSTDGSVRIASEYSDSRIRFTRNDRNLGVVETLNRGLDLADGEYIARMDCDDISLPNRLAAQVEFLDQNPDIGICGTWVETIGDDPGKVWQYPVDPDTIKCHLLFESALAHPSVMMRRSMLEENGLKYDKRYMHAEDWELWQRSSFHFPLGNVPSVLFRYRISPNSVSRANAAVQRETLRKIDEKNLTALCGLVSSQELDIHRAVSYWQCPVNIEFLEKAGAWLEKLRVSNELRQIYPEPQFSRTLMARWFQICSIAAPLGLLAWFRFWRTGVRHHAGVSPLAIFKFFIKCILRWQSAVGNGNAEHSAAP